MTRPVKRPRADHTAVAKRLRDHPGMWLQVSTHRALYSAARSAAAIRTAYRNPAYGPAGCFDARTEPVGDDTAVYARYLGVRREAGEPR